ncbi:30S ribosomal protein S14 [Rudaeicoccus suwonensis]|uniref:Small ribosomal subunit protein uS14 n=1 Tax=Rudaeicoccus suwonensis TaxID=657409 RepID=A0A561E817_9MICO|nr:30S ribosomal protein S14 [Rudaeicoccus suwonensis]TWE11710.1 SSU ribosomal protein S14P [Rudaeicoccus suwonensis]
MAKKSMIAKQAQREATVARYAERRSALKETARVGATERERAAARAALATLPRDASPTRLRNRDVADGRPRGHLRAFGLSRVRFRQMALNGELPGVTKSSW